MNSVPPDGLFDLQVNGFAGVDFQRPVSAEALHRACLTMRACGMQRVLATLITDRIEALETKFRALEAFRRQDPLIRECIVGFHLEGPFLSTEPGYRGAHDPQWMRDPHWEVFAPLQEAAGGLIRLVTLAPERVGSAPFIRRAVQSGVRIALGHTNACDDAISAAIDAGTTLCTHLGNGCPTTLHRHDNIIQRLLARDELTACFIPDGIHLPPMVLRNLIRAKDPAKVILTTDAMAAAGAPPGRYTIGAIELEVGADGVVRLPGSAHFAGSALRLDHGVANAARWLDISLEEAAVFASSIPAVALGYPAEAGR
jgi:N-acetylglucosamine-6-phosphate deacetylase